MTPKPLPAGLANRYDYESDTWHHEPTQLEVEAMARKSPDGMCMVCYKPGFAAHEPPTPAEIAASYERDGITP